MFLTQLHQVFARVIFQPYVAPTNVLFAATHAWFTKHTDVATWIAEQSSQKVNRLSMKTLDLKRAVSVHAQPSARAVRFFSHLGGPKLCLQQVHAHARKAGGDPPEIWEINSPRKSHLSPGGGGDRKGERFGREVVDARPSPRPPPPPSTSLSRPVSPITVGRRYPL